MRIHYTQQREIPYPSLHRCIVAVVAQPVGNTLDKDQCRRADNHGQENAQPQCRRERHGGKIEARQESGCWCEIGEYRRRMKERREKKQHRHSGNMLLFWVRDLLRFRHDARDAGARDGCCEVQELVHVIPFVGRMLV